MSRIKFLKVTFSHKCLLITALWNKFSMDYYQIVTSISYKEHFELKIFKTIVKFDARFEQSFITKRFVVNLFN